MLSNSPGKGLQFEKAPFKLTSELVEVMGGLNSPNFSKFRKLIWKYKPFLIKEALLHVVNTMKRYLYWLR
jgi:phosphatidylinositol kinase/protein kinase (PI-3  family)